MLKISNYIFLVIILSTVSISFSAENINKSTKECNLTVTISGFESNKGNVRVQLYNEATSKYFPDVSDKAYKLIVTKIGSKKAIVVFENIPFGKYAVTCHHDENLNIKMDRNFMGMPSESWGLSNNVRPLLSLPKFEECSFTLNNDNNSINLILK